MGRRQGKRMYPRGNRIYFRVKVDGKWLGIPTDFTPDQERAAKVARDELDVRMAAGEQLAAVGPVTLRRYYDTWIKEREAEVRSWKNDECTMRLHVLPTLGSHGIAEVTPLQLFQLVKVWRKSMAPKSVHTAYSTVSALFRDACIVGIRESTPCILTKRQLGPKHSENDREWRKLALYKRDELEILISDERIPMDRRVLYSLEGIGALRHGEAAGLFWRHCGVVADTPPLGQLYVAYSYAGPLKTDDVRVMPIHPTLASILAEWKLHGWAAMMGRTPTEDDLVVPLPPGHKSKWAPYRTKGFSFDHFEKDLVELGMRHRRGHDLRRTGISLSRSDGAAKDILNRGTHKAPKEVMEGYTTYEWDVLCREVAKLNIHRRGPAKVIDLPTLPQRATGEGTYANSTPWRGTESEFATGLATPHIEALKTTSENSLALPGLELRRSASEYVEAPADSNLNTNDSRTCDEASPVDASGPLPPIVPARSNVANEYLDRAAAAGFRVVRGSGKSNPESED